jgi:hypothetical protein
MEQQMYSSKQKIWALTCLVLTIMVVLPMIAACSGSSSASNQPVSTTSGITTGPTSSPIMTPVSMEATPPTVAIPAETTVTLPVTTTSPTSGPIFPAVTTPASAVSPLPTITNSPTPGPDSLPDISTPISSSPSEDDLIEIYPCWKAGERHSLEIVKTREKQVNGKVTSTSTARVDVKVSVIQADEDGYVLEWTYGETKFDDPDQANNPLVRSVSKIMQGLVIELQMDAFGPIIGVPNWEEVQKKAEVAMKTVTNELKGVMDQALIDTIINQVSMTYSSEENIMNFLLTEPQLLVFPLGWQYTMSEPIFYEDLLPNPMGGDPIPSEAYILLKDFDIVTGDAKIEWKQSLDPEKTQEMVLETMKKMAAQTGKTAPDAKDIPELTRNDSAEFTVNANTGWVKYVHLVQTVQIANTIQTDTLTISSKEMPDTPVYP